MVFYTIHFEACHARGIASNDNEWRETLNEVKNFQSPKKMRELFAIICALNVPANALVLWNEFEEYLNEDFRQNYSGEIASNRALLEIEDILLAHNVTCESLGLPTPTRLPDEVQTDPLYFDEQQFLFNELYTNANQEQRNIIDMVLRQVQYHDTGSNVFCLTAHAGCGKTFLQTALIHKLNALNLSCIATAFSGIASTLLLNGKTLHNVFKLPIPILDNSVANINLNSAHGRFMDNQNKHKIFAGKTILLCGDFRQILPVVPHGSRAILIENCVTSWNEFQSFHRVTLTQNMRALPHEIEFVEFLKRIGNGTEKVYPQFGQDIIEIPHHLLGNINNIISEIFGNIADNILSEHMLTSVILAPTNEDYNFINEDILNRIPGEEKVYYSSDKLICDDQAWQRE